MVLVVLELQDQEEEEEAEWWEEVIDQDQDNRISEED
jgi:hypothetical protein